jgi:hypothetical protein
MSSQIEFRRENARVLEFLRTRADSRGIIREDQKTLAAVYGTSHTNLHRSVHRLIANGRLKVLSKGGNGRLVLLLV